MRTFHHILCIVALLLVNCSSPKKREIINARITAYTHTENDHIKYKNKTTIGTILKPGICATNWAKIPLGSKLLINDHIYTVEDIGSALCSTKYDMPIVDLYFPNKREMRQWGVKYMDIEVLEWGDWQKSKEILAPRLKYKHCRYMYDNIKL